MINTGIHREDIMKRFNLPERKSKINTILKLQGQQPIYCLCHSSDANGFMICCEKCDEWYHGDCVGLKENDAILIKKWYCFDCIEQYGSKIVYISQARKTCSQKKKNNLKRSSTCQEFTSEGLCFGQQIIDSSQQQQEEDCSNKDYSKFSEINFPKIKFGNPEEYFDKGGNNTAVADAMMNSAGEHLKIFYPSLKMNLSRKVKPLNNMCNGPDCTKVAQKHSKYCSDECGMALAKLRIFSASLKYLKQSQRSPSRAEQMDSAKLKIIRSRKITALRELHKLDIKEKKLWEIIARAKQVPVQETEEEIDEDNKMFCVTCGWEVPSYSYNKHMESCFRKLESQIAIVGWNKTNSNLCHIYCDYYDTASKTFCKRLRYVCPDHFKPIKTEDDEVCGCPIIRNISQSIFSNAETFCQKRKNICDLHHNWENMELSNIDLERQQEWNKIVLLTEEEKKILRQMAVRLGVLSILLHSTYMNDTSLKKG